jgi:CHAT domain-containing protein
VGDTGTIALMSEFYTSLQTAPTKAEALRQAQLRLLNQTTTITQDNRQGILKWSGGSFPISADISTTKPDTANKAIDLSLPIYWSSFTLVGSPW